MRTALTLLILLAFALAYSVAAAHAAAPTCAGDYADLQQSLNASRYGHAAWVSYLEANPGAYVPADVVSLDVQRGKLQLYNQRLWAVYYLARGDQTYLPWLDADFSFSRDVHLEWASYTGDTSTSDAGLDAAAFNRGAAAEYDRRLAVVQRMTSECAI